MAELVPPQQHKKRRGALHKLSKMLLGGKPAGAAYTQQGREEAAAQAHLPPQPRRRPNPAALTAPLEHSMRQREAAELQGRVLQEQAQHLGEAPEPEAVPAAIRQHLQQQHLQPPAGQQQEGDAALPRARRQQLLTAAEEEQPMAPLEPDADWGEQLMPQHQQQRQHPALPRSPFDVAKLGPAAAGRGGRGPLQELHWQEQAAPVQPPPQQQRAPRPSSGLSEPEAAPYAYPDAAAAGYAAGLAALEAEALAEQAAGGAGAGAAAAATMQAMKSESWDLRRLHVVHSNALYEDGFRPGRSWDNSAFQR